MQAAALDPPGGGLALAGRAAPLGRAALEVGARERPVAVLAGRRAMVAALHFRGLSERNDGGAVALGALGVDAVVVVAHVERGRLWSEPAGADCVEQWGDEQGLMLARGAHLPSK